MGLFTPGPRVRNRQFNYEPRFYDPQKDENIRRRMRIQSKVHRTSRRPISVLVLIVLLSMAVWLMLRLGG